MSTPQGFVLDGSVTLAWYFADEADSYADEVGRQHGVRIDLGPLTGSTPAIMNRELLDAFGAAMGAIGCLMTLWVGVLTIVRG